MKNDNDMLIARIKGVPAKAAEPGGVGDPNQINQFDSRFHPWPGWPNSKPWCTRCTFEPRDDYERLAEKLVERMHLYAMQFRCEPHQLGEGYNNVVRMAAFALREVGRVGIRKSLKRYRSR